MDSGDLWGKEGRGGQRRKDVLIEDLIDLLSFDVHS
jgi:hypothetical protein